eukprot:1787777-Rhodomonas_salina.1
MTPNKAACKASVASCFSPDPNVFARPMRPMFSAGWSLMRRFAPLQLPVGVYTTEVCPGLAFGLILGGGCRFFAELCRSNFTGAWPCGVVTSVGSALACCADEVSAAPVLEIGTASTLCGSACLKLSERDTSPASISCCVAD